MKVRTLDQLLDRIASDRVWRIREIAALRAQSTSSSIPKDAVKAIRRSFVPIAYAHWEGFVKKSAHYYLEYVSMQGLNLNELSGSFMSLYLWKKHANLLARGKNFSLIGVCDALMGEGDGQVYIQYDDAIPKIANVDSEILRDICSTLGISFADFEIKSAFINSGLVGRRNAIAHGEAQDIEAADLEKIKDEVVNLIDLFRSKIENAAVTQSFKRQQVTLQQA